MNTSNFFGHSACTTEESNLSRADRTFVLLFAVFAGICRVFWVFWYCHNSLRPDPRPIQYRIMSSLYPYNRIEECSWQPEEAARNLAKLIRIIEDSEVPPSLRNKIRSSSFDMRRSIPVDSQDVPLQLISRGWSSQCVHKIRILFGENAVNGRKNEEDVICCFPATRMFSFGQCSRWFHLSPCLVSVISAFVSQLKEPLILMLLASAIVSLVMGQKADAISIGVALTIVSLVAAIQEYRSEEALEKLVDLVPHTCTVIRDGRVQEHFLAKELVVGDLVVLGTGDRVPADCRLIDTVELYVDESSLTGENHPVNKTGAALGLSPIGAIPPITEQHNIVFMGTLVCSGRGRALVVSVGYYTEFGKVAAQLNEVEQRKSPLQIKIDELGRTLAFASSILIAFIALLGWLMGRPLLETINIAVSLAVAAIPEGLPICVTVTLALGVLRMARAKAIIKKLPVVESLGCANVIASDKTGTLTQNEMTCRIAYTPSFPKWAFAFKGVGYSAKNSVVVKLNGPVSHLSTIDDSIHPSVADGSSEYDALQALLEAACLCNNASFSETDEEVFLSGQPTEIALLVGAKKMGITDPRPLYYRLQEIPFTSDRKRMEVRSRPVSNNHSCNAFTLCQQLSPEQAPTDNSLYFVKGMPEAVIGECVYFTSTDGSLASMSDGARAHALSQSRQMASLGLRVLAIAYGTSLKRLTFAGLLGMEDPPRHGVKRAVQQLKQTGVTVVMVTGDSKETALSIARRCGIIDERPTRPYDSSHKNTDSNDFDDIEFGPDGYLSGEQLDAIAPSVLPDSISGIQVFYRVAPRHKLALVRAFQARGDVVAMTGDGVNDSTALKAADIGVAMGKKGTDVAKEAADMILADDDFSTIVQAVSEGKGIFFNIRNFLAFQLSTSFAALAIESTATIMGMPSPLNPMQILWINIIMDGPPAQSLGVEPVHEKILLAKPRKASEPILTRSLLLRAITNAALIVYLTLRVFYMELGDGGIVTRRDTTMTFMTFVNCDLFNAYACRSSELCFYELDLFSNTAFLFSVGGSILGQLAVIYFPPLQEVFQTEALSMSDIIYILILSSSVLMLDTLRKKFFLRLFNDSSNTKAFTQQDVKRKV